VKSPTYTIVNEYRGAIPLYHYDMYRIEDEDDLYSTGYDDYMARDGFIVAEWSEKIDGIIPPDAIFVTITRVVGDEGAREIKIDYEIGEV
jgi:tRNA threonylcarbamoyladenosine biosynthesis protein TsaE